MDHEFEHNGKSGRLNRLTSGMVILSIFLYGIGSATAVCGMKAAKDPKPSKCRLVIYGACIFFLVMLPYFMQGSAMRIVARMSPT